MTVQTNVVIIIILLLSASILVSSIFCEKAYLSSSQNPGYCNSVKIRFPIDYTDLYNDETDLPFRATRLMEKGGTYEIQWKDLELKDFPVRYYQLSNTCATILDLDYNLLTKFPENIEDFNGLEALFLRNNEIRAIKNIKPSLSVRYIYLDANKLKAFPYELLKLEFLRELKLANNYIEIEPLDSLIHIENCKVRWIDLTNNQIKKFPTDFGKLKNLELLDLFKNRIQDTIVLDGFNALTYLEISNQYVEGIDIKKNSGTNLQVIQCINNRITFFETESILENVRELDLRLNYLQYFPNVEKMPNLREIDVSDNGYLDIPESILKLENLEKLIIAGITYSDDSKEILKQLSKRGVTIKTGENSWFEY